MTRRPPRIRVSPEAPQAQGEGRGFRRGAIALAVAALVGVCLLLSAIEAPLPALGWAAAFLVLAVERDVRERRIPNWLTFPALAFAIAHATWSGGIDGALASLAGAGAALGILLIPYAMGWFGAGDVKAVMALGAFWGAGILLPVLGWAIALGGLLAIGWLVARGGLRDMATRWWQSLRTSLVMRKPTYFAPAPGSVAAGGVPFAVAIGLGVAAYQLWGLPWV
jgi:prepilin peptidase CpaA